MSRPLTNLLQSVVLLLMLFGLPALCGFLLFGEEGFWIALAVSLLALAIEPAAAGPLTLRLYRAQPIPPAVAPELWQMLATLAERAGLPSLPHLHYVPSRVINAFAVGSRQSSAIALSDGLLRAMPAREIFGVLAHEVAHIAHGDLCVMTLADYVSRLTAMMSLLGQILLLLALPLLLLDAVAIDWLALLLLVLAPHLALLAQLGLSRVREFAADATAAELTGDARGLAQALARIEGIRIGWRGWLLPGWGNPQPSWLRTHPPTEERIARLLRLEGDGSLSWSGQIVRLPVAMVQQAPPRWRLGGYWW